METHSHPAPRREPPPHLEEICMVVLVAIVFVLLLLLGESMVQHRFFWGGRVHDNGSIGQ